MDGWWIISKKIPTGATRFLQRLQTVWLLWQSNWVALQSCSEVTYDVDMIAYTCTCIGYPCIQFCKHICAVQAHFPSVHQFIDLNKDPQKWLFDYQSPSKTPTTTPCIEPHFLDTQFSHPFLGTYKVIQFFELANLEGTPFQCGIWAPYQFYDTMGWKSHKISLSFQYHVTSYHTIGIIEAFEFQSKPYHHSKAVTGWGLLYKIW